MARAALSLPENVPGEFYVDSSCIDCATCRRLAPESFAHARSGFSFVSSQPISQAQQRRALLALVACPTASIGSRSRLDAREAAHAFPVPIEGEVYDCGYTSPHSYGATSYLVRRAGGNLLVDSPRAAKPLLERITALGGVRYLFLSHRDDVADHAAFARRFGCERILHEADVSRGTRGVERRVSGGDPMPLADDMLLIPVPGHTAGSTALLYRETYLFTGDHLMGAEDGTLRASRAVCWDSWSDQLRSLQRLLEHRFRWVLPGHGLPVQAGSWQQMRERLRRLLERLTR